MPMQTPFIKMHGLGNDFLIVRAADSPPLDSETIRRLADRKTGIGFDQLLWLEPGRSEGAEVFYRIFNRDGYEVEQCGNGARCIARLLAGAGPREILLEHCSGTSRARVEPDGNVTVEMGVPEFRPELIPFTAEAQQDTYELEADGERVQLRVVSIGNPHAVINVDSVVSAPIERLGPLLECHDRFPNRANIGFMQVVSNDRIRLRVFERGVGETQACGTGACAAVVVGHSAGILGEKVKVELPGGEVTICWEGPGSPVWLSGEAVTVFEGTVKI
jgi:diaminopimelate epimerase